MDNEEQNLVHLMYEHQVDEAASQDSTTEQPDSGRKGSLHSPQWEISCKQETAFIVEKRLRPQVGSPVDKTAWQIKYKAPWKFSGDEGHARMKLGTKSQTATGR